MSWAKGRAPPWIDGQSQSKQLVCLKVSVFRNAEMIGKYISYHTRFPKTKFVVSALHACLLLKDEQSVFLSLCSLCHPFASLYLPVLRL